MKDFEISKAESLAAVHTGSLKTNKNKFKKIILYKFYDSC